MVFTEEQLRELASQLCKPHGENGIDVSNMMHQSNFGMTKHTIKALSITKNDKILELGHGNGRHINEILNYAGNVFYYGLEIAELMKQEAESQNLNNTSFYLYDGQIIPFDDMLFDKILTVNTIYFWQNPVLLLNEIYRVLKSDGVCCIGFAIKEFMQTLPFTKFGFRLYDDRMFKDLVNQTTFKLADLTTHREQLYSKTGEMIERSFSIATLQK